MSRALSSITSGKADLGVANGAGMPALGLSAAAVLVNGLVVRCDPRLPSHPNVNVNEKVSHTLMNF